MLTVKSVAVSSSADVQDLSERDLVIVAWRERELVWWKIGDRLGSGGVGSLEWVVVGEVLDGGWDGGAALGKTCLGPEGVHVSGTGARVVAFVGWLCRPVQGEKRMGGWRGTEVVELVLDDGAVAGAGFELLGCARWL